MLRSLRSTGSSKTAAADCTKTIAGYATNGVAMTSTDPTDLTPCPVGTIAPEGSAMCLPVGGGGQPLCHQ